MNIAFYNIYKEYSSDRLFDNSSCIIGENILMPRIRLKEKLEGMGHTVHTADIFEIRMIDKIIFDDLPSDSLLTIQSFRALVYYFYRKKWKEDYLLKSVVRLKKENIILLLNEPPVVREFEYKKGYHRWFGKIITWKDDIVDNSRYYKLYWPQFRTDVKYQVSFNEKKRLVMMCGNKGSGEKHELYSERRKVIDYYEANNEEFDLYGFGWEDEHLKNYKGCSKKKLSELSKYKFAVCFENMSNIDGYFTEKIFDCFFSGCVPIYWGGTEC